MLADTPRTHGISLAVIFFLAFLFNSVPYFATGISPAYRQSSDTTVHLVHWRESSKEYAGNFDNDLMFQNFEEAPSGVLLVDTALMRASEFLGVDFLLMSIVVSWLTLALFLTGVYFLVFYSTREPLLALLLSLVSIVPVISLGLSGWEC